MLKGIVKLVLGDVLTNHGFSLEVSGEIKLD